MITLRSGGFIALAIAAGAVFFALAPEAVNYSSSASSFEALIGIAMDDYEANDERTESAPQQQVVNGWVARDLLQIVATELADQLDGTEAIATQEPDDRVPALLVLIVLGIAWWGVTEELGRIRLETASAPVAPN